MHPRDRLAAVLVLAAAGLAAFAIGGTPRWAASMAAFLGAASAAPYIGSRRGLARPGPLLVFLAAALVATALQLLPLPLFLVHLLSPGKAALVTANAAALGQPAPSLISLSYDPPATLVEIARLVGYLGLAYAATRLAARTRGRQILAWGLGGLGVLMMVVIAVHVAVGARALYGVYVPRYAVPSHLAPILNPNHLASFLALLAPICIGLAVHETGGLRIAWAAAAVAISAGALLTGSRAGAVALGIGLLVTALLLWTQRRPRRAAEVRSTAVSVAVILACLIAVVGATAGRLAWHEIEKTTPGELTAAQGKLAAWRAAMPLLERQWLTGVGRGGFESAFTSIYGQPDEIYSHIENTYLQAGLDWGIPIAAALGVLLLLVARRAATRWSAGPVEAGLLGGVLAVALHDTLDFSLSFAGVAAPTIIALALLVRGSLKQTSWRHTRLARASAIALASAVALLAMLPVARSAREDTDRLVNSPRDQHLPLAGAESAWARHPADYLAAGDTARALLAQRDPRAVAVLGRALTLYPRHPGLHLLAAHLLLASPHPDQALVEYRLALENASGEVSVPAILSEVTQRFPHPEDAVQALPLDPDQMHGLVTILGGRHQNALALVYARRVAELYPDRLETWREVYRLAHQAGDTAGALAAARSAMARRRDAETAIMLGTSLMDASRPEEALAVLQRALREGYRETSTASDVNVLRALAQAQLADHQPDSARETLEKAVGLAGTDQRRLIQLHQDLAALEEHEGNEHRAQWHQQQAAELARP